jgi:replicative DNA helicase
MFIRDKLNLNNDELIVLGARPGMGKTLFALSILYNSAQRGCFISLNETADEISYKEDRMKIKSSEKNYESICVERPSLLELMELIESQKYNCDYFIIDDMSGLNEEINFLFNKTKNYQFVIRHLKLLAKCINKNIILISQLDRIVEEQSHETHYNFKTWDEKYIDHILILYRKDYYNVEPLNFNNVDGGQSLLYVAKTKLKKNSVKEVILNFKYPFWSYVFEDKYLKKTNYER